MDELIQAFHFIFLFFAFILSYKKEKSFPSTFYNLLSSNSLSKVFYLLVVMVFEKKEVDRQDQWIKFSCVLGIGISWR